MQATADGGPPQLAPQQRVLAVFSGLIIVMLLSSLDATIVATALPTIAGDLGGLNHLSWVVTGYLLAETVATPLYGKLGDQYGRKGVLQSALIIFLVGSALCGISRNMTELIAFRAFQGIGGGGLSVTSTAVIGDVVSPRERGRYEGIFGAVFAVATVVGPFLGGFFVDHLSWHWIFYINLPLGVVALAVIGKTLSSSSARVRHRIDYLGTALIGLGLSGIVLFTSLGGSTYAWSSPQIIGLAAIGVAGLVAFVFAERRAAEPVLPLSLFRNRVFSVSSIIGLIIGLALFGSVTYLPVFLQVVKGASASNSGIELLPLMGGVLITSVLSGALITRWGRYKVFPIVGTAIMTIGLFLLSRMNQDTSTALVSGSMFVLGFGLGCGMQVLVLAVQNAVDYKDLGVATSGATLFRQIGGSLGTAVYGAIFSNQLAVNLRRYLPAAALAAAGGAAGGGQANPAELAKLPPVIHAGYVQAYAHSLQTVFLVAVPIAAVSFLFTWFLPEVELRQTAETATGLGDGMAVPRQGSSLSAIERALSILAFSDSPRRIYERLAARAGLDLAPAACWLLARTGEAEPISLMAITKRAGIEPARLTAPLAQLEGKGLVQSSESDAGGTGAIALTAAGKEAFSRLVAARRERLAELLAGWSPEQSAELAELLTRLAQRLVVEAPAETRR